MAKWNLDTIEADMAEIRECVDKLQEINRLQAQTIERQALEIVELVGQRDGIERLAVFRGGEIDALREQLRQAQQSLRNARDAALEEAADHAEAQGSRHFPFVNDEDEWRHSEAGKIAKRIRSLKSTTQGSRE